MIWNTQEISTKFNKSNRLDRKDMVSTITYWNLTNFPLYSNYFASIEVDKLPTSCHHFFYSRVLASTVVCQVGYVREPQTLPLIQSICFRKKLASCLYFLWQTTNCLPLLQVLAWTLVAKLLSLSQKPQVASLLKILASTCSLSSWLCYRTTNLLQKKAGKLHVLRKTTSCLLIW